MAFKKEMRRDGIQKKKMRLITLKNALLHVHVTRAHVHVTRTRHTYTSLRMLNAGLMPYTRTLAYAGVC